MATKKKIADILSLVPNYTPNRSFDEIGDACEVLEADGVDRAVEYLKFRESECQSDNDKLQVLFDTRSCIKHSIAAGEFSGERLKTYEKYLLNIERMIENINCCKTECEAKLKLSNKKGAKADFLRVFNALYELRYFETPDGKIPSKEKFMQVLGGVFSVDTSKYHSDLSQAIQDVSEAAALKIFDDMKAKTKEAKARS
jgi:hypothetical protein